MLKTILAAALMLSTVFTNGCSDSSDPASGIISDPHDRWKAYTIRSYTVEERRICFCLGSEIAAKVVVVNDSIVNVIDTKNGVPIRSSAWGWYKTVDELFQIIGSIDTQSVAAFSVAYDPGYGYPSSIFVDPNAQIADEEYGYSLGKLTPFFP